MKTLLKWTGRVLGGIVVLLLVAYMVLYFRSESIMGRTWDVAGRAVTIQPDSAALARADHFVHSLYGCAGCHGDDLAGGVMYDGPPGRFVASNLTPGGVGAQYTDEDWDRAIRHGVGKGGRTLLIMGADRFRNLSDLDFAALIAYIKSRPAVTNTLPRETLRPLGRVLVGAGVVVPAVVKIDHDAPPSAYIPPDTTAPYGEFLTSLSCVECHGPSLSGGPHPDPAGPNAPNLAAAGAWPKELFIRTLRTGVTPDGRQLDPNWMPWPEFKPLTDGELAAMHAYLGTLAHQSAD
ncbi:MAG: c-type cytochrome [Rhodothermales bacterium]